MAHVLKVFKTLSGLETAKEYTKKGAHVTIVARNLQRLQAAVEELQKFKVDVHQSIRFVVVDVSSSQQQVSTAFESLGTVDVLINSAGYPKFCYTMQ